MTIQVPYRGIIEIVGEHDSGKTIAMLQTTNNTKDIVFVDDDVKGDGTVRQMSEQGMEFAQYIDLSKLRAKLGQTPTADELLKYVVLPTVEEITSTKRKVIVWDTWRIVYQSARGHVERNQSKYSSVVNFRGNSQIIQGLISKVARMIELKILNELKASCDLLLISHHLKEKYVLGNAIGKMPESSATFDEVCNMRMWLRKNSRSKVPIILFLKRPSLPTKTLRFVNVVPLKITPTDKHQSIWDAIAEYEKNPMESRAPKPEETPTADELAAITGALSPEQEKYLRAMIEYQKTLENELEEAQSESKVDIKLPKEETIPESYPENGAQLLAMARSEFGLERPAIELALGMPFKQINATYKKEYWDILLEQPSENNKTIGGGDGKQKATNKKRR